MYICSPGFAGFNELSVFVEAQHLLKGSWGPCNAGANVAFGLGQAGHVRPILCFEFQMLLQVSKNGAVHPIWPCFSHLYPCLFN